MKIRFFASIAFAMFLSCFAYGSPIVYTFTNASDFTLNGVSYTGPYLGLPPNAPELTFTMNADTGNITQGPGFIQNIGTTTVSYGGTTLATLTDSMAIVIHTGIGSSVFLIDETKQATLLSDPIGPYNGATDYPGTNLLGGGYPLTSTLDTSAGPLVITDFAYQGQFKAAVASAVPEPFSFVLLATGALGFAGVFRRQLLSNWL